ncbi:MAG: hypothetical protein KDA28_11200, partial [Phycisphaerales bacterium]|nr:hypothetical protein [Phycisphaerales bacterium]
GTLDDVVRTTGFEARVVQTALTHLELRGLVRRQGDRLVPR